MVASTYCKFHNYQLSLLSITFAFYITHLLFLFDLSNQIHSIRFAQLKNLLFTLLILPSVIITMHPYKKIVLALIVFLILLRK